MPVTPTPDKTPAYPGRDQLNLAQAQFRRACARLNKEAIRHDPELTPKLTAIVIEAAEHLTRLAGEATAAESGSTRNRAVLKTAEERLRRNLRQGARRGSEAAARTLAKLDARQARREQDEHGDDAA
ncbi:hypothetical protein [Streptomyces sp. NBC_00096]|uniref:hypothetical protein n=1 Tax=Streptomyces sp. NBC_00096 TaxID=2975650 RepID=UPI003255B562